jgi:hypothetical protein
MQILTTLAQNTSALSSLYKRIELALSTMFAQLHQQRGAH